LLDISRTLLCSASQVSVQCCLSMCPKHVIEVTHLLLCTSRDDSADPSPIDVDKDGQRDAHGPHLQPLQRIMEAAAMTARHQKQCIMQQHWCCCAWLTCNPRPFERNGL
jgi:hypothetical protein